eukprot:1172730-Amphidinium_carterae.2
MKSRGWFSFFACSYSERENEIQPLDFIFSVSIGLQFLRGPGIVIDCRAGHCHRFPCKAFVADAVLLALKPCVIDSMPSSALLVGRALHQKWSGGGLC